MEVAICGGCGKGRLEGAVRCHVCSTSFEEVAASVAIAHTKQINSMAVTGFVAGIVSIFLAFIIVPPLVAVTCSAIGLATFNKEKQKGNWMSVVGLILGILFLLTGVFSWMK